MYFLVFKVVISTPTIAIFTPTSNFIAFSMQSIVFQSIYVSPLTNTNSLMVGSNPLSHYVKELVKAILKRNYCLFYNWKCGNKRTMCSTFGSYSYREKTYTTVAMYLINNIAGWLSMPSNVQN